MDSAFLLWHRKGLKHLSDLYDNNSFPSFDCMVAKFSLPRSHFFHYLQIRNFMHDQFPSFLSTPLNPALDTILEILSGKRGLISRVYNHLLSLNCLTLLYIKFKWEGELGVEVTDDWWERAQSRVHSTSSCTRDWPRFTLGWMGPVTDVPSPKLTWLACSGLALSWLITVLSFSPLYLKYYRPLWIHVHYWQFLVFHLRTNLYRQNMQTWWLLLHFWLAGGSCSFGCPPHPHLVLAGLRTSCIFFN